MRKLAIFAYAFSAAIFASQYLLTPFISLIAALLALAAALILSIFKCTRSRIVQIAAIGILFALLWNHVYTKYVYAPANYYAGTNSEITVTLRGYAQDTDYGISLPVRLDGIGATLFIYSGQYNDEADFKPGDILQLTAEAVLASDKTENFYYESNGTFLFLYAKASPQIIGADGLSLLHIPARMLKAVSNKIDRVFPGYASPFMKAVLIGDRNDLNEDSFLNSAFSITGITHIIAVSGMHLTFLVEMMRFFLRGRRKAMLACIPVIFFFMAFIGFSPSVTRAGVMEIFLIAAPFFSREYDAPTAMGASLMLFLFINPFAAQNGGLQLSYACVAGIMLFGERLLARLQTDMNKPIKNTVFKHLKQYTASTIVLSLSSMVFVIPLIAIFFKSISIIAPLTNLLILWAVTIIFSLGFACIILGFIWAPAATVLAYVPSVIFLYIKLVASTLSSIPFAALYLRSIYIRIWLIYAYLSLLLILALPKSKKNFIVYSVPLSTLLCLALILSALEARNVGMIAAALDVGQGACAVFTSSDCVVVIDCGGNRRANEGDYAADYILSLGYNEVDYLILTHFHDDHADGAVELMQRLRILKLIVPEAKDSELRSDILAAAEDLGVQIITVTDLIELSEGELFKLTCYQPVGANNDNENGLSVLCSYWEYDALVTGDMSIKTEERLLDSYFLPDIELLFVSHHGSAYSTSDELLNALRPETAIISVGRNHYGHPSDIVLTRLKNAGSEVFRTDINGDVTVRLG